MTKKLILVIIPIIVLLLCCVGALLLLPENSDGNTIYLEQIKVAHQLKEDGDYQLAILHYKEAIKEDNTQEEPYYQMANIYYYNLNDIGNAITTLEQGIQLTNSYNLRNLLQIIKEDTGDAQGTTTAFSTAVGKINTQFVNVFTTYKYKDYSSNYTLVNEQISGGIYTVEYSQIDAAFIYYNTDEFPNIINSATGMPNDGVRPCEIKFNSIDTLIGGASSGVSVDSLKKSGAMNPKVTYDEKMKKYLLSFVYNNCSFLVECSQDGKITGSDIYNVITPEQTDDHVQLSGYVYNEDNSNLIEKAQIDFRKGHNNQADTPVATYTTTDGSYYVELDPGNYTAEVSSSGFKPVYFDLTLGVGINSQDFTLTPVNSGDVIRVVVEWADDSTYITSHAHLVSSSGYSTGQIGDYEGYHGDTLYNGDTLLADYKRDESSKSETTTFYDPNGSYEFHVHHDFENPDVKVKLYMPGESEPIIITEPDDFYVYPNFYWTVFSIRNGKIEGIYGKEN